MHAVEAPCCPQCSHFASLMINACEGTGRHFFHVTDIILSAYSVRKKITDQDSGHCKRPNLDFMHVSTDLNYMLAGHVRQGCIPGSNTASNPWYPCATSHRIKDHIDNGRHHLSTFTMHWWLQWSSYGVILEEFWKNSLTVSSLPCQHAG